MSTSEGVPEFGGRQPNLARKLEVMKLRLAQKAQALQVLEEREAHLVALTADVVEENTSLLAAMDQINAENSVLRRRLGLPEAGVVELTDEEVERIGDSAQITETVDEPTETA